MQSINYRRVVAGGIVAAIILMVGEVLMIRMYLPRIIAERTAAGIRPTSGSLALNTIEVLVSGLLMAWLYAAMRPRFGPGVMTAIRSALAVWVPGILLMMVHVLADDFGFSAPLLFGIAGAALPVYLVGGLAAGRLYQEP